MLPIADALLIALGALLLAGVNPFARLPQPSPGALGGHGPTLGAFLYGLLFAPIAVPRSGPFLVGIFAFSLTIGDALDRLAFFASFGIGFGLPLFVLGSLGQVRGARWLAPSAVTAALQLVLGVALLAVGCGTCGEPAAHCSVSAWARRHGPEVARFDVVDAGPLATLDRGDGASAGLRPRERHRGVGTARSPRVPVCLLRAASMRAPSSGGRAP